MNIATLSEHRPASWCGREWPCKTQNTAHYTTLQRRTKTQVIKPAIINKTEHPMHSTVCMHISISGMLTSSHYPSFLERDSNNGPRFTIKTACIHNSLSHLISNCDPTMLVGRTTIGSKAQNPMEKRGVAYFRLGSHPSLSATLRCLFTIRMWTLMCASVPLVF